MEAMELWKKRQENKGVAIAKKKKKLVYVESWSQIMVSALWCMIV